MITIYWAAQMLPPDSGDIRQNSKQIFFYSEITPLLATKYNENFINYVFLLKINSLNAVAGARQVLTSL